MGVLKSGPRACTTRPWRFSSWPKADLPIKKDSKYLQNILRNDYQKHFQLPMRLAESEIEPFALPKGLACLAHNIDPKLVGKEVIKDDFKRTTLVIVGLQETYLIKAALYYDFPDEPDYEEMLRIVRSCRIQF